MTDVHIAFIFILLLKIIRLFVHSLVTVLINVMLPGPGPTLLQATKRLHAWVCDYVTVLNHCT